MTVYDEKTHEELKEYNLEEGCILEHKSTVHHEASSGTPEKSHYERIVERDFKKVIDEPAVPAHEAYDEIVVEYLYHKYTAEEIEQNIKEAIRQRREKECFPIINRGQAWYNLLTFEQREEIDKWYIAWLNATETGEIPEMPVFINEKIKITEDIL
jgi:hypothetical protein